jgi:hypothetical protein
MDKQFTALFTMYVKVLQQNPYITYGSVTHLYTRYNFQGNIYLTGESAVNIDRTCYEDEKTFHSQVSIYVIE